MGNQIPTAYVEGFKNNIYMLAQQKETRLFSKSRNETQNSKQDSFEVIGLAEGQDVTSRHGDTPINNTPHSRRWVTLSDSDWGELVDKFDRVRMLINPNDAYVQAAVAFLNRKKDDIFIAAALGSAKTGDDGELTVALPNSQKMICTNEAQSAFSGLNVFSMTVLQQKFDDADIDESETRHLAINGKQRMNLLNDPKATSADYASLKALVDGKIGYYMGFNIVRTQRLPVLTTAITTALLTSNSVTGGATNIPIGSTRCFAWVESGMVSSMGVDGMGLSVNIAPDPTKKFSTRLYACQSVGAVRMEEVKVVEIICAA